MAVRRSVRRSMSTRASVVSRRSVRLSHPCERTTAEKYRTGHSHDPQPMHNAACPGHEAQECVVRRCEVNAFAHET
jgi:hypothetical protein